MLDNQPNIREVLRLHPEYKCKLFERGYIVSQKSLPDKNEFPFYSNWKDYNFFNYIFRVHKDQKLYFYEDSNKCIALIGNCLNPFDLTYDENIIVKNIHSLVKNNLKSAISYINQLTGSFSLFYISNSVMEFLTDPSGMLFSCYAIIGGKIFVSSHTELIADICKTTKSEYIKRLENYKYFYKYGLFFPGDLTQYKEVSRVMQNHIFSYNGTIVEWKRFFPSEELVECKDEKSYVDLVANISEILHNTMLCVTKKWDRPAISLTGGMDSKTTLASTNGLYDKFDYYSYNSMDGDVIDAEAAHKISESLNLNHIIYNISRNDSDYKDISVIKAIIEHNNGGYKINDNDIRKRCFFTDNFPYDVEVKSWVSEIARANYYKKFGLKKMPYQLSQKNMTSMYKVFLYQRCLAAQTNKVFKDFIKKSGFHDFPLGYDSSDMYLWEFRYSAWGGQVITSEHSFSNEIFIPFNNRILLNMMLTAPKDKRISDEFHEDIIRYGNKKISDLNITITNWNETKSRMYIEKIYYVLNSHIL